MASSWLRGVLVAGLVLLGVGQAGAEPAAPEQLPPPRVQAPPPAIVPPPVVYYSYPRVSRYEVWRNLGVDHFGRFRPLVIYSPYGSYYRYNGAPFPWVETYTWEFQFKAVGSP